MSLAKNIFDKAFGFKGVQLRSNIIGNTNRGLAGVNPNQLAISGVSNRGATTQMNGSKLMSEYYRVSEELKDYELSELTLLILTAYKDFIEGYFSSDGDCVSFIDGHKDPYLDRVNKYMTDLCIRQDIKSHLNDILYWNNYCCLLGWDSELRTFVKKPLLNDHSVITVKKNQEIEKHLILDKDMNIREVGPYSLIRYGDLDLSLENNIREEGDDIELDTKFKTGLVKKYEYLTSMPLYYEIVPKVKEYILNDQIISLLNIKDLIQPLLLLINCDKNTDVTTANNLANNIENLINKYVDISTIFTARFSVDDLMDSIINNIRVIPDYSGAAANLGTIDLSKLKEKVDQLRGDQDNRKEAICNSLSLTMDFLQGRITKWDALKQSERLNSCINSKIASIDRSVIDIACNLYYLTTKRKLNPDDLKSNIFVKTATQLSRISSNSEVIASLTQGIYGILDQFQQSLQSNKLIEPTELYQYVKTKLALVDPDAVRLLTEDKFMAFLKSLNTEEDNGY